jgi:DNA-binding CsgD family transcriptional regulator
MLIRLAVHGCAMVDVTEREREILELVRAGTNSPSQLAEKLGISQSGASQALKKLAGKGRLVKRRGGRSVTYESPRQSQDNDLYFLSQAYNSLSQVWAFVMSKGLPREELKRAREARDTLEDLLAKRTAK